jgi:DNA-binding response OmpR family regulator
VRVLIVEDEVRLASALQRGLASEGFTVDLAHTGPDGLHLASETAYDAVILDVMLPGRNGYEICRDLRAGGDWTPILMLTAKDGDLDESEGLDTGADDYLTKPFSFADLTARVRALLRRAAHRSPVPLEAGPIHIDPAARRVSCAGAAVALTAREFDVLEHLVRRAGTVVSKDDILGGVWDSDFEGDPNIVEVYVRRLRRKLDTACGVAIIETVRGAGYRIGGEG